MAETEIERRITAENTTIEYREMDGGEKRPVIVGYAAVFQSPSHDLGGFIETIHPRAFDDVLKTNPDVVGVFNHDKNMLLARSSNGSLRLKADPYGLRYEMTPPKTKTAEEVVALVSEGYVTGSSVAFAVSRSGGDSWSTDANGVRRREIRSISLLDDVGPVVRPAYGASSVVVSRRAVELALGDAFRPNQTMANAARRVLRSSKVAGVDQRLLAVAERVAERSVLSVEEVEFLAETHRKCHDVRSIGWKYTQAWVEWMLAGGDSGEAWVAKRAAAVDAEPAAIPTIEDRAEPGELSEGDFAAWDDGVGRVEHVMTEGSLQGMSATEDAPLAVLTPFEDGEAEDYMVAKMVADLTKVDSPEAGMDDEEDEDDSEDRAAGDKSQSTPAPKEDQISGSDKNKQGSAKNASGRIKVSETTRKALSTKVVEHNAAMREADKPAWSRTSIGQLLSVYRRGAGAYSTSHRPGVSRGAWAMARVNAYLYLLRNGRPEDSKYVTDNDLLPSGHPKASSERSIEATDEERAVSLRPSAGMASAARRGLRLHEEGKSGDGLKPETVARANKIARREELTADHVREMNAWFARHQTASKSPGWDTPGAEKPGFVAWLLWGGTPAQGWAARKVAQMERESERSDAAVAEEAVASPAPEQPAETPVATEPAAVAVSVDTTQFDAEMAKAASKLADLQAALLRIKLHDVT